MTLTSGGPTASTASTVDRIEAIYRARYPEFVRVCRAVLGDAQAADDAVQEGFARALRQHASFAGSGSLDGWVWRIVINAARDHRRKPTAVPDADPAAPEASDVDATAVRAAVARLPERQRLVLFLRYYADLDYAQIGEALGIASGTIGATLHTAQASLRTVLQEPNP